VLRPIAERDPLGFGEQLRGSVLGARGHPPSGHCVPYDHPLDAGQAVGHRGAEQVAHPAVEAQRRDHDDPGALCRAIVGIEEMLNVMRLNRVVNIVAAGLHGGAGDRIAGHRERAGAVDDDRSAFGELA
jgi:hypothetical protein